MFLLVIFNDSNGKFYLNMLHDILGFYSRYLMKDLEMFSFILLVKWLSLKLSSVKGLNKLSSLFFNRSKVKKCKSKDQAKNVEATHTCLLFCLQTFSKQCTALYSVWAVAPSCWKKAWAPSQSDKWLTHGVKICVTNWCENVIPWQKKMDQHSWVQL